MNIGMLLGFPDVMIRAGSLISFISDTWIPAYGKRTPILCRFGETSFDNEYESFLFNRTIGLVIEDNKDRWKVPEGVKLYPNYEELKNINKLIITGSAILHDNFDEIINTYKNLEKVAIVGPSMGAIPEPFFEREIDAIGGMKILSPEKVQGIIMESGGTQQFSKYCQKYLIINPQSQNSSPLPR